jgi:proteasome lid subunit RPN8/RPN11
VTHSYLAPDASVAVDISGAAYDDMLTAAQRADRHETGGILVGRYSEFGDRVTVAEATTAPADSQAFPAAFVRGVVGLSRRLRLAWKRGLYYVGEWHYHPYASPQPSGRDIAQIIDFSRDGRYQCPHPILVIVGGNPRDAPVTSVHAVLDAGVTILREAGLREHAGV